MERNNLEITRRIMLTLLPIQVILAMAGAVNGLVSSYFASNFVGIEAMSAVGLYGPVSMFVGAIGTLTAGGCAIICGKYLGANQFDKLQEMFSLDLLLAFIASAVLTGLFVFLGISDLTGIFTQDATLRPVFNQYLLGQTIGITPQMFASQLPMFLTMQNKGKNTMRASVVYIIVNLVLNYYFVEVRKMEAFGLALASSLGMWVFFIMELYYFLTPGSQLRVRLMKPDWSEAKRIITTGLSGASGYIYQTFRGLAVNKLLEIHVGSMGISAFAAANNLLGIFWAIPGGMLAVSRMQMSVAVGEEDRQTLGDITRVMFRTYLPMMAAVVGGIILGSGFLSGLFFNGPEIAAYGMMKACLQIIPLCMPLSIICAHFNCYAQILDRTRFGEIMSALDGLICVAGFSWLLTASMGIAGVAWANVLNGIVTTLFVIGYSRYRNRHLPKNVEELMVIPEDFGASEDERMDITVDTIEEVVQLSQQIQQFCRDRGIDEKRSYLSALALEEMAGVIVLEGFVKDSKKHSIYVRVVHKDDNVILRIKDDCQPFNPEERKQLTENEDITKNIGIRMIYKILKDIDYRYLFGINVLTMKI